MEDVLNRLTVLVNSPSRRIDNAQVPSSRTLQRARSQSDCGAKSLRTAGRPYAQILRPSARHPAKSPVFLSARIVLRVRQ